MFDAAVKEILDEYFKDTENADESKIAKFSSEIDKRADSLLKGYRATLEERQNAASLEYETEYVNLVIKKSTLYKDIQAITDHMGGEIDILDGGSRELKDYMAEGDSSDDTIIAILYIGISL